MKETLCLGFIVMGVLPIDAEVAYSVTGCDEFGCLQCHSTCDTCDYC